MFWGLILILIGLAIFAENLGIIRGDFWDYFWPIILIAVGGSMIFKQRKNPPQQ